MNEHFLGKAALGLGVASYFVGPEVAILSAVAAVSFGAVHIVQAINEKKNSIEDDLHSGLGINEAGSHKPDGYEEETLVPSV